jgi:hypothetical protein
MKLVKILKAFPSSEVCSPNDDGMTMLDYFAAKALPAIILKHKGNEYSSPEQECEDAYLYAFLMVEESNKYER